MMRRIMKGFFNSIIITFALCATSCSTIRGLRLDGAKGPTTFSYVKRDMDVIASSNKPFHFFKSNQDEKIFDTLRICRQKHIDTLQTITDRIRPLSPDQSVVIIRNDTIVYQKNFGRYDKYTNATIFSVSKSLTSLLCGIAIDEGYIKSVNEPVTNYLPELKKKDKNWQELTILDLLNMRSGIKMKESYKLSLSNAANLMKIAKLVYGKNEMKLIKQLKFSDKPGTKHNYTSVNTQILDIIIERATHQPFAQYMSEKVWKPLGMERNAYVTIDSRKHDHAHAFGGIATNIMDLAKIGRLYLNHGVWNGKRIVSENWIRKTMDTSKSNDGYHLSWYNNYTWDLPAEHPCTIAIGFKGQIIYINPYKNYIMVRMGATNNQYYDASWIFHHLLEDLAKRGM